MKSTGPELASTFFITGFLSTLQHSCHFDPSMRLADTEHRLQMIVPAVVVSPRNENFGYHTARFALVFDVCLENIVLVVALAATVKPTFRKRGTPPYLSQRRQVAADNKASGELIFFCKLDESRAAGAIIDGFYGVRFERRFLSMFHVHIQHSGR